MIAGQCISLGVRRGGLRSQTAGRACCAHKKMHDSADKFCKSCQAFKPLAEYHMNRTMADGRQKWCKICQNRANRENQLRRGARGEESGGSGSGEETAAEVRSDMANLYVMANSRITGEYKVGRSKAVEQRREDLHSSQNFRMVIVAIFPGAGDAEGSVHNVLAHSRVHEGPGREWFRASLSDILHAVGRTVEQGRS